MTITNESIETKNNSIASHAFMYLGMLYEMGFLSEGFSANLASERFLSRMRSQMYFDIGFIQEASIANVTSVHSLLFS